MENKKEKWVDKVWGKTAWRIGIFCLTYGEFHGFYICEILVETEKNIWGTICRYALPEIKTEEDAKTFLESKFDEILLDATNNFHLTL
jgi:hypothetical protein